MKIIKSFVLLTIIGCFSCSKAQQETIIKYENTEANQGDSILLKHSLKLYSEALKEDREILISLPENYHQEVHNYPIIYVMDADHVAMLELTRAITNALVEVDLMPKSIIVGLTNNGNLNNRFQMTSGAERGSGFYENKAKDYLHFLEHVVKPYVKTTYRVTNHETIIGLSPSNGPLHEALYKETKVFDAYVFLAADLYFRYSSTESRGDKLMKHLINASHPKSVVYFGMASDDVSFNASWGKQFQKYRNEMSKRKNLNVRCMFGVLEGEGHYEMAIKGIKNAFKHIYNVWHKKTIYHVDNGERPVDIKKHFDSLSTHYGFKIFPPESKIEHQTRALLRWGKPKNIQTAIFLLKQGVEYYPNAACLHLLLAKAYQLQNNTESMQLYFEKAKALALKYPPKNYNWFAEATRDFKN